MKKPPIPKNEIERIKRLYSYKILDSLPEDYFDNIVKIASNICDVPISLISIVDSNRQWFKAKVGIDASETPRDISFCAHAINHNELFYIEDALKDERFHDNPIVVGGPQVVFYAGMPIIDRDGFALGTLCVIDHKPRVLNDIQKQQLELLSKQVATFIKFRDEVSLKINRAISIEKLSKNLTGFIYTYQINPDGSHCFPFASRNIYEIYEVTPEDVLEDASVVFSRLHPEDYDRVAKSINESAKTLSRWECDYRVNLPIQGVKWVRGSANPEKLPNGSILWHGYISDITDLKNNEEKLFSNHKMAALGEMAANIAHEINNPLTVIKSSAYSINKAITSNHLDVENLKSYSLRIEQTSERIAKIVKGLSMFSRHSQHQLECLKLHQIIDESISFCEEKFKLNNVKLIIEFENKADLEVIECRSVEISQVILNLLNNAFDAVSTLKEKWVKLHATTTKESVVISVIDSGSGIPESEVKKILNPFYTTKAAGKGTGLGLSISQKIIDSHHGVFWIDVNSPNTKFTFTLKRKFPNTIKKVS